MILPAAMLRAWRRTVSSSGANKVPLGIMRMSTVRISGKAV